MLYVLDESRNCINEHFKTRAKYYIEVNMFNDTDLLV
jgi:hypothetical protein